MKRRTNESRLSVHVILVKGPKFLTIGPNDGLWLGDEHMDLSDVQFARVQPPENANEEAIARVRSYFGKDIDVQVAARPQTQVLANQAVDKFEDKGLRETVVQMVEEAIGVDREALRTYVEQKLAEVKL